jgi:hypothetical protein
MFKKLIYLFIGIYCISAQAQDAFYQHYSWDANPKYTVNNTDANMVAVKEKVAIEFTFEGQNFVEYFLEHRVLWLNSDDAIERYNRVYLPYTGNTNLEVNKARVIKKNGEILELDESKVLTAENEETGRKYKYFAFEGVEKGSFIEYYYIQKKSPSYTGKRLYFQSSHEKQLINFDLYAPNNLLFDFKNYNGIPEVQLDTMSTSKKHWTLTAENIAALDKESQAAYNAMRGFIIYKLYKNTYNSKTVTSYDIVVQNLYAFYYPDYDAKLQKQIDAFSAQVGITADMDTDSKIRTIDAYIKQNVFFSEARNESLEDLGNVLENKTTNETGVLKLYIALLRKFEIKNEMVITCERSDLKFDKEFEANNFLVDFLFYFPDTNKYLAPAEFITRYGFPPFNLTDTYGLFIKKVTVGSFVSALGEIRFIDPVKAEDSSDTMLIDVSFDPEDLTVTTVKLDRSMKGYNAMYVQPFLNLIEGDKMKEMMDSFILNVDANAEVKKREMPNSDPNDFGVKPFDLNFEISSESFVNKAGNKYLFKLGDLIGPQIEMYQEKKRVLPLESQFQRSYYRTIKVNIPEGYKIANLDAINIKNIYTEEGKEIFVFDSYYKLEGNVLTVTADEHYRRNIVAPELYEEYRTVINSAADFNKITLVLEPK